MADNLDRLRAAFVEALGLGAAPADFESLTYRGIREWDSVAHMQLIAAIEATFELMLDTDDVIAMSSYAKAREIVAKHGVVL